jgi:hypothetical protein
VTHLSADSETDDRAEFLIHRLPIGQLQRGKGVLGGEPTISWRLGRPGLRWQ